MNGSICYKHNTNAFKRLQVETNTPKEKIKRVPLHNKLQLIYLLTGGEKKLKKESTWTVFGTVLIEPLDLCFCFFFTTFIVTFLPFFQSIVLPYEPIQN